MSSLRVIYAIFLIVLFVLLSSLYFSHKIEYESFSLFFLLAAPLAYYYPSYRVIAAVTAAVIPVLIFIYKLHPMNAFLSATIFGLFQVSAVLYKEISEEGEKALDYELREEEKKKSGLLEKYRTLQTDERDIKDDELMIVNLFEITRKMSENLRFIDIFNVFSAFLKGNFLFRKCDLLILNWEDLKVPRLERADSVWQEGNEETSKQITNYDKLIKNFLANPRNIHASKDSDNDILENIGVFEASVSTF